jgi:transcriptional regulator with XRE-family HTH domain
MDDAQVGSVLRAVRIRRGLTQAQLGRTVGLSRPVISLIERGGLEQTSLRSVRSVARGLGVSLWMEARWRGAETARLLDERHAALVRSVVALLRPSGWTLRVEYTFNVWGERGSFDVLAWHPILHAVLAVEVKTRLVDLQDLLSVADRKRRLLEAVSRNEGWRPIAFGSVIAFRDESWARRAVHQFGPIFEAAFPARTVEVRRWVARPVGQLRGIWFLANDGHGSNNAKPRGSMRVRPARLAVREPNRGPNEPDVGRQAPVRQAEPAPRPRDPG